MLSRSRFAPTVASWPRTAALLLLGVTACAGNSDVIGSGTGGNQTGTAGTGGTSASGTAGTTGTAGTMGAGGTGTSTAGTGGSSATGTAGSGGTTGSAGAGGTTGSGGTTGAAGRGGTTGTAGTTGAAGRGGTTGTAGTTGTGGTTGAAGTSGLIWPNETSSANSDDWLAQNHDRISQLRPRVLAMDIGNTSNAMTLIQRHIDGLANATSFHKYNTPGAQPMVVYQLVKVVNGGSGPNYTIWNS